MSAPDAKVTLSTLRPAPASEVTLADFQRRSAEEKAERENPAPVALTAIPFSELPWLGEFRARHMEACAALLAVWRGPLRVDERQARELADWRRELFELAAGGGEPPMVPARFEPEWRAGERAAAERAITAAAQSLLAVWEDLEQAVGSDLSPDSAVVRRREELGEPAVEQDVMGVAAELTTSGSVEVARARLFVDLLTPRLKADALRAWVARAPWLTSRAPEPLERRAVA